MAISNAVNLANLATDDTLTVDISNDRVGIGSTQPTATLDVNGIIKGDGSQLTGDVSSVDLKFGGTSVGTAVTALNFAGFSSVTAPFAGLSTVTAAKSLIVGTRAGTAVTFNLVGNTFSIPNRAGGTTEINV